MDVQKAFKEFVNNLNITNKNQISERYKSITRILNNKYWDSNSELDHSLQIGSYGRKTAINGVSDLDMLFELPHALLKKHDNYNSNGQSALLQDVKNTIKTTYSQTDIRGDGQVVVIKFNNHKIEVLPAFGQTDGSYKHPNSNDGGSWAITRPREEIEEINLKNNEFQGTLKHLCKMVRSWKNKTGASVSGLLIDTICYNFLLENEEYKERDFIYYDWLARDCFEYMSNLSKDQKYWFAPGSNQRVYSNGKFIAKAKKAQKKCLKAIDKAENLTVNTIWKEVFGRSFPAGETAKVVEKYSFDNTEEYIEDRHVVDIFHELSIDCHIKQTGVRTWKLRELLNFGFPIETTKSLQFHVTFCDVPEPYIIKWKVRNVGEEAKKRDMVRGQIHIDGGNKTKNESSNFDGQHFVECYAIKDDICVARDRIDVPISGVS